MISQFSVNGLLRDTKLIKNAVCTDWPVNFLGNKDQVMVNKNRQVTRVQDARQNETFAPDNQQAKPSKPLNPTLKLGMSKDSPFHSSYTKTHPATKKLLDYPEPKKSNNLLSRSLNGDLSAPVIYGQQN